MITASLGSHRFEAGPTFHYNSSNTGELIDTMFNPDATTNYVNVLKDVDATTDEIRQVAAAGIVRIAVAGAERKYIPEAKDMLLKVCSGDIDQVSKDIFTDPYKWFENAYDRYKLHSRLGNATMDSASVLATRKNNAAETAGLIDTETNSNEGIFVIGLANGGILSAAHTFLELGGENNDLFFVKYSRYKHDDKEPDMYPYPDGRKSMLRRLAKDRQVVIYDEDYSSGKTIRTAVDYFAELFGKEVMGIAPVEVKGRITYKPLVVRSE